MTQTIEQLTAKVAELEEENARLSDGAVCGDCDGSGWLENRVEGRYPCTCMTEAEPYQLLTEQLAAAQLNNKMLRKALEAVIKVHGYESGIPVEALAQPSDTFALDAYVAEKVKEAVKEADDQILAAKNLLAIMHRDGGHHEFAVGFDQAIQDAMAVYYELTKQRDLAVEALEKTRGALAYVKANGRDNPNLMESTAWHGLAAADKALATIKESDGK